MASASLKDAPTYGVEVNGKTYPHHLRTAHRKARSSTAEKEPTQPAAELLADSIWNRLPFADSECVGKEELVDGFSKSVSKLQTFHAEFDGMLRTLCRVNISVISNGDLQQEELDAELSRRLDAMYRHGDLKPLQLKNPVDATLLAKPAEVVQQTLTSSLRQLTNQLVLNIFRSLDRLTDRNVTGVIEWTSDATCKFHFFTESLEQTTDHQRDRTETQINGIRETRTTIKQHAGRHLHLRVRHEHHLIEAQLHAISDPSVQIPRRVQPLIAEVPTWLRPVVRIVTGKQIREDTIEQERSERGWLKEEVKHTEVAIRFDPTIIVGDIVLAGWDERELQQEKSADQAGSPFSAGVPRDRRSIGLMVALATTLQLIALGFTLASGARTMLFIVLSGVVCLSGVIPIATALWWTIEGRTEQVASRVNRYVLLLSAIVSALLGLQFLALAWAQSNLAVGLIGSAAAVIGGGVLLRDFDVL